MFSAADVLSWTGGRIANEAALSSGVLHGARVSQPAVLGSSRPGDVAFFFSSAFQGELATAQPSVLITGEDFVKPLAAARLPLWQNSVVVVCSDPYLAMALVTRRLAPAFSRMTHLPGARAEQRTEIHPSAVVDPQARVGSGAFVGAQCVIEAGAEVGAGAVLYPHCYIGPNSTIGEGSVLFPHVTIYEKVRVGARVRLHSGVVLGADGFGYAPQKNGNEVFAHEKIFHFGGVVIGDDVEIGANTCVDRGTFADTVIEKMVKIDNHVQIGHNCRVEEGAVICGASGLAGSAHVGRFAYVGGLTGIANQIHLGDRSSVGACSLIAKDVPAGEMMLGNPQRSYRDHFRVQAKLNRLVKERRGGKSAEKESS